MDKETKLGRPKINKSKHKRSRAISLTDNEYQKLKELALVADVGVSAYIIKLLKLS